MRSFSNCISLKFILLFKIGEFISWLSMSGGEGEGGEGGSGG
jgi:hypothetical protein